MIKLQDKPVTVTNPVEIDKACNDIRLMLSELPWVSHPYHIAQRFYRKEGQKPFYYPETFVATEKKGYNYHRLTPDNDYSGMFFFMVGDEKNDFAPNEYNYLRYPVGIIFSANLEKIDQAKLDTTLFTQELIRDVRRELTTRMIEFDFHYTLDTVSRDLRKVYREFVLDDIEQYNRAPMQCFRFDINIILQEEC